jgi:hypothetical protein
MQGSFLGRVTESAVAAIRKIKYETEPVGVV